MADKQQETRSESTSTPLENPQPPKDLAELSEEELEKVSGGVAGSCATGKHFKDAILTS